MHTLYKVLYSTLPEESAAKALSVSAYYIIGFVKTPAFHRKCDAVMMK